MPTTLFLRDSLGRKLVNGTPGTTQATGYLGRAVASGTADYMGKTLITKQWTVSTAFTLGQTSNAATGEQLTCTTAGTTSAGAQPTAPGFGLTRVDGTVTWTQTTTT